MIVTPFTKPDRFVSCPACGKGAHSVSHLKPGTGTAWYCDERDCGKRFGLKVLSNLDIELKILPSRSVPTLVTLRSVDPVTIVVEGIDLVEGDLLTSRTYEHDQYFYDESTCPTNYLKRVIQVQDSSGDSDPHGIFKYVKTEPWRDME